MTLSIPPNDAFNKTLIQHTHPAGWQNPIPKGRYNLVVIGGGTAGLVAAMGTAGLGGRVALIEKHLLGGDCLNFGCVPSKALIRSAENAYEVGESGKFGMDPRLRGEDRIVNFPKVMERMRSLRADISHHDSGQRFSKAGVDVFLGAARFLDKDTVEVDGQTLKFKRAVIATGARASIPPIPGLDRVNYLTNETIFNLVDLPKSLCVIGGGPIGCELAQTFQRLGCDVTMLVVEKVIMPNEDPDLAQIVQDQMANEGVTVINGVEISAINQQPSDKGITYLVDGKERTLYTQELLLATGRKASIDGMDLEKARVEAYPAGIKVNDYLQTTNKNIYAAGDVCSPFQFTHAADAMARIVIQNALFFGSKKVTDLVIPWATFTYPQIAHVGIHQAEAELDKNIESLEFEMKDVDRAILDGETLGKARIHYSKKKGFILGCTLVSRHAGDLISEISLAMTNGVKMAGLAKTIHPYPTQSEVLKRLGDAYSRTRLTPKVSGLLKGLLKWRR